MKVVEAELAKPLSLFRTKALELILNLLFIGKHALDLDTQTFFDALTDLVKDSTNFVENILVLSKNFGKLNNLILLEKADDLS